MKKILTILTFLFISLIIKATDYYVATNGNNNNNGSVTSPWASLSYACAHALNAGDVIHVLSGSFNETSQCRLAVGVSIEGTGVASIINSTIAGDYTIVLSSTTEGTSGNQHIRNIKMSGGAGINSEVAYAPILVDKRSNVEISNCTFQYFFHSGVKYQCSNAHPTIYPTGNSFHDNIILDCCTFTSIGNPQGAGWGCLEIGGQQGMLVYNNNITVSYRTGGLNGYDIKYAGDGYNKGLKIYNNILNRPPFSGMTNDFDFSIELWNSRGGIEIYNNIIQGGTDMSGDNPVTNNDEGGYGFAYKIHNNTIGWSTYQTNSQNGVYIERAQTGGEYIYNNSFNYISTPVITYQGYDSRAHDVLEDVFVYNNVANNIGYISNHYSNFVDISHIGTDANPNIIYRRIYFINNTVVQGSGGAGTEGFINIHIAGTGTYFYFQNNIMVGLGAAGTAGALNVDGTNLISLTHVTYQNNVLYQNHVNGWYNYYGGSESFDVNSGNIISNPLFISTSNFHLQAGSPAIGAGVHITTPPITTDFDGNPVANPPSIGAYEYNTGPVVIMPTVTTTAISAITQTIATSGGNVTADGGAAVTARGVCWAITINPTIANSKTTDGSGTGAYVSQITALTPNTTYHVRAYATNSAGTGYGTDVSFNTLPNTPVLPTVTTTAISAITQTTATSGGNVTADGGSAVTVKGICWATTINPTIANFKTTDGSGTGAYVSALTALTPATQYHVRAYATNSVGTAYGNDIAFTTTAIIVLPTVTTAATTNKLQTSVTSGGNVTADGGSAVTVKGVCWAKTINPTIANSITNDGSGLGVYVSQITGLTAATQYHVRAYATNGVGTAYGSDFLFTTASGPVVVPTLTTSVSSTIVWTAQFVFGGGGSSIKLTVTGNITSTGGSPITAKGICWSTFSNPTTSSRHVNNSSPNTGTGIFTSLINSLSPHTLYHIRAFATNVAGTAYGNDITVTVPDYQIQGN